MEEGGWKTRAQEYQKQNEAKDAETEGGAASRPIRHVTAPGELEITAKFRDGTIKISQFNELNADRNTA